MLKIGLTGNIACGKSTAAEILSSLGYPVVDADQISRQLCSIGQPGYLLLIETFGDIILTPSKDIDREKLRNIVFANPDQKKKLEEILHPLIMQESRQLFKKAKKDKKTKALFYEASLLFESGRQSEFDGILLITCPENLQLERLLKRNPELSEEMAKKIVSSQLSQEKKARLSKWVLVNDSDKSALRSKITEWAKNNL